MLKDSSVLKHAARPLAALAVLAALACGDEAQVIGAPEPAGEPGTEGSEGSNEGAAAASPSSSRDAAPRVPAGNAPPSTEPRPPAPAEPTSSQTGTSPVAPMPMPPAALPRELRGACDLAQRIGGFSVEAQADFGVVQGAVADAVLPTAVPRLVSETGSCKVLERRNLVCLPACVGAEACGELGSCIPYPRQVDVGVVDIAGLTRATSMSPLQPGNTYFSPGADNPPYAGDATVVLSAAGGSGLGAFELLGRGSEPLLQAPRWQLGRGTELSVTWPAPSTPGPTHVLVELTIDQHGVSPFSLECEFADTGSATVPAALIDQLIDAGVSGFPNGKLTRRTADHVQLAQGCVDLVVGSPRPADVTVAGFTPCNGNAECPAGQSCNTALQRCE